MGWIKKDKYTQIFIFLAAPNLNTLESSKNYLCFLKVIWFFFSKNIFQVFHELTKMTFWVFQACEKIVVI